MHVNFGGSNIPQVPLGVILEVVGDGHPNSSLATLQVVLEYDARDRTAFTHTGTVT